MKVWGSIPGGDWELFSFFHVLDKSETHNPSIIYHYGSWLAKTDDRQTYFSISQKRDK